LPRPTEPILISLPLSGAMGSLCGLGRPARGGAVLVGCRLAFFTNASYMPEQIEANTIVARQLVLTASDGEPRMLLNVTEDGQAGVSIYDLSGRTRAMLFVNAGGQSHVAFFDTQGMARIDIAQAGIPAITLRDSYDVPRLIATLGEDGTPLVLGCDEKGAPLDPVEVS